MTSSIEAGDAVGKPREILIQGIAHLIALCSFSVAQPVYDVLADSPELFTSYRVDGLDLIAFILTISLVIPAVLATLFVLTLKVSKNCGKYYFRISAGLLLVLFVSLALRDTEISVAIRLGIGVLIALGALMLLEKSDPLKIWLSWLAVGALIFPISFLFNPNISTLFSTQSASISSDIESAKHPVFLIVFDKLPTSILINKNHEIDSDRYPNFSAFANDAYWFRNNTASAQDTISSVPNILTGNYPEGKKTPNLATYPRNLFVHMQNNFNMNVMEYVTSLNPAETDLYAGDRTTKYRLMMADIFLIYLHMTLPDQLRQRLPSLEERTFNFWSLAKIPPNGLWRMVRFIKRIGDEKNWFHYLHIDLPHGPFMFRSSGTVYTWRSTIPGLPAKWGNWSSDQVPIDKAIERFIQQVLLADNLLGDLIEHLKKLDIYDESTIVVTSDHGGGFSINDHTRAITKSNYLDVLYVPLFIKLSGQTEGKTSDINSELVDIFPTIVDSLDGQMPWKVDGVSLFQNNRTKTGKYARAYLNGKVNLYEFPSESGGEFSELRSLAQDLIWDEEDQRNYSVELNTELIGQQFTSVSDAFHEAKSDDPGYIHDPNLSLKDSSYETRRGWIRGPVTAPASAPQNKQNLHAAVIYDDEIIAMTRLFRHKHYELFLAELLPEKYLPLDPEKIRVRVLK